jgi:hypothetical protein
VQPERQRGCYAPTHAVADEDDSVPERSHSFFRAVNLGLGYANLFTIDYLPVGNDVEPYHLNTWVVGDGGGQPIRDGANPPEPTTGTRKVHNGDHVGVVVSTPPVPLWRLVLALLLLLLLWCWCCCGGGGGGGGGGLSVLCLFLFELELACQKLVRRNVHR